MVDNELRAIYRDSFYKDFRRWLIDRRSQDCANISDDEMRELCRDALREFESEHLTKLEPE